MQTHEPTNFLAALSRLFWMMVGPMLLAILTYLIIKNGNGWLTGADLAFLALLLGLVAARWLEFRGGHPLTAEGEPAAPRHLRNYGIGVLTIGLAVYVVANVLGNFVLAH